MHPARRKARAQLASATARARLHADDPTVVAEVEDRRRTYRYLSAEDYIRRLVDEAPPLTPDQRDRLAVLLRPSGRSS
jgi:hypothetical protein